ncbi:MAG TPA: leucyl/phenylalanyl-tRNA--protein transferase [Actinoplanes sp.]|nr:leucyl/phenylalanyl-tRNA--protein transferase [Actinoplanes sp.]
MRDRDLNTELRKARRAFGFPPVSRARADGLLAVGGDLSPERLLVAYANGIFPWPSSTDDKIPWFCPTPRAVLVPGRIRLGRTLRRTARRAPFAITFDRAFPQVITACAELRRASGTWITPEMTQAYIHLHRLGFAHSVEAWREDTLVGGVYGVSLGSAFFGESMFRREPDASKLALLALLDQLHRWNFAFLDCQQMSPHVERLGAVEWSLDHFQSQLGTALETDTRQGSWSAPTPS